MTKIEADNHRASWGPGPTIRHPELRETYRDIARVHAEVTALAAQVAEAAHA